MEQQSKGSEGRGHARDFPVELLVQIFGRLSAPGDLLQAALVCRSWAAVILPTLWTSPDLSDDQVPLFVRGLLASSLREANGAETEEPWVTDTLSLLSELEELCQKALAARKAAREAPPRPVEHRVYTGPQDSLPPTAEQQQQQPLAVLNTHGAFADAIQALLNGRIPEHLLPPDEDDEDEEDGTNDEETSFSDEVIGDENELNNLNTAEDNAMDRVDEIRLIEEIRRLNRTGAANLLGIRGEVPDEQGLLHMQHIHALIDQFHDLNDENEELPSKAFNIESNFVKRSLGWGKLVKTLRIPSDGDFVRLLSHVNLLMPRLKTLHSYHPPHDQSKVPTLSPEVLSSFQSLVSSAHSLIIEDVSKPIWHGLLSVVSRHGMNLRHLDVEATGELEPFFSRRGIFSVLAKATPNLECLRVDGISVGLDKHVDQLVASCTKLRAITVDYCYGITIQAFVTLWNGLPNLEFIGFAGIIGPLPEDVQFELRPNVKTIRFVDCDISDEFFESLAPQAPNLDMIRIVFEDYQCLEILQISAEMTDRTLRAFHRSCPRLRVMAITRCPLMTGPCFGQVIGKGSIKVLDLHKSAGEGIGKIDDDFLAAIGPWLNGRPPVVDGSEEEDFASPGGNVTTINFYGQTKVTEGMLIRALESGWFRQVESLSLNHIDVAYPFLECLAENCLKLRLLSLKSCPRATYNLIQDFLKQIDALTRILPQDRSTAPLHRFKRLYALEPGATLKHPMLDVDDRWFGDEALDITSLWTAAVGDL